MSNEADTGQQAPAPSESSTDQRDSKPESPFAPLRNTAFRFLWLAGLGSAVGTWMQTVGAQWLLLDEPNAETVVALVQTAGMLPVLLLSLPAGVLADTFDRRRLLLGVQSFMACVAVLLTVLTAAGQMTPALLLAFTFALGCGTALTMPAWQSSIPDLVPRAELPAAAALGGVSVNLARAVGPAIAGVMVAQLGVEAVFAVNAASFVAYVLVLSRWRPAVRLRADSPEPFVAALRAGGRYVRHSRVVRRILIRLALFVVPAAALWALLPLTANRTLGLGAGGYGLLLTALGVGAVAGALALPRLRTLASLNTRVLVGSLIYATTLAVLTVATHPAVAMVALVPAGAVWTGTLSSISASLQMFLPSWVRARGLAAYSLMVFGGQALGALMWGVIAQHFGLNFSLLTAAIVLALGAATVPIWGLHQTAGLDRSPANYWPDPGMAFDPHPDVGPVVVTVTYVVAPEREAEFLQAMAPVRRTRRRTGATSWSMYRDGAEPDHLIEIFVVPSWEEHLRQHEGRLTGSDQAFEEAASAFSREPLVVQHLLPAGQTSATAGVPTIKD